VLKGLRQIIMTFMLWAIDVPQMSLQREAKMRIRANL